VTLALAGLYLVALLVAAAVTALKAKWWTLALGVAFGLAWLFGAVRLAKPRSWWARRFYDEEKQARAESIDPRRRRIGLVAGLVTLASALAVFALAKAYRMPSAAMEPTLRCGEPLIGCAGETSDRVLAVRFLGAADVERGDIVAFEMPDVGAARCGVPPGSVFIKRVVGLPGETVAFAGGGVTIDGEPLDEPYLRGRRRASGSGRGARLGSDEVFVLGDNRAQSCDSSAWGALPRDRLIAQVHLRYWPLSRFGRPS
jgi:signal peptidase I